MGQRKKPYAPKLFESSRGAKDPYAGIYETMLRSPAFLNMTKNQRLLYVYMKAQYYGKRKPKNDFPDIEQFQRDDLFYFNMALAEKYGLYSRSNDRQFYADIKAIEQHGFIKTVSNGRSTKSRSIYQFTSEWQQWNDSS